MEAVIVRSKDGIVRNVVVHSVGEGTFRRNQDRYQSRGYIDAQQPGGAGRLHVCENVQGKAQGSLFSRAIPGPFASLLLFGDPLFVAEDGQGRLRNFGQEDFCKVMENAHPVFSPGRPIPTNLSTRVQPAHSIEEMEEDDEETTMDGATTATVGTFGTYEAEACEGMNNDEDEEEEEDDDEYRVSEDED